MNPHRPIENRHLAAPLLALALGLTAPGTPAEPRHKGYGEVCADDACGMTYSINRNEKSAPAASVPTTTIIERHTRVSTSVAAPPPDLELDYRWSGPGGNGKAHPLDNGSTLYSGDEFTIRAHACEPLYLYLFHFDSGGQLNELVSLSGHDNRLAGGASLELPTPESHFGLDPRAGTETIHTIVASVPMPELMAQYRDGLAGRAAFAALPSKGIYIADDRPKALQGGRLLACPAESVYCREEFRIRHLAGPRPAE